MPACSQGNLSNNHGGYDKKMEELLGMIYQLRMFCVLLFVVLCAAGCSNKESEKAKVPRQYISAVADKTMVLATITTEEKPQSIAPPSGLGIHPSPATMFQFIFSELGGGVAYIVEKAGMSRVVHNGNSGKPYKAVGTVALSPDGKRIAYGALVDGKWRMVIDGKEGAPFNTLKYPVFSPDGAHLAYQAMAGERWHIVVDTTPNQGTLKRYLYHEIFSADSSKIAYVEDVDDKNRGRLVVSDLAFAKPKIIASGVSFIISNKDKSRVAAISASDNKQGAIDFSFDRPDAARKGTLYDAVSALVFGPDCVALAYVAERAGKPFMVLGDRELALPDGVRIGSHVIHPDKKTVGVLMSSNNTVFLQQLSPGSGNREIGYEAAEGLEYSREGRFHVYAAQKGESWFVVVNGKEGPAFDRVVTPKFSPDGKFLVYRARKSGKRFVVVADTAGNTIKTHPAYEQVFDVVFTGDGKSVAYGVKDGPKLIWKVEKL